MQLPRRVAGVKDFAEVRPSKGGVRTAELRMVEGVEALETILETHSLADLTKTKLLEHGQIGVVRAGVAHFAQGTRRRAQRVRAG